MALPATDVFTGDDGKLTAYSANWTNNNGSFDLVGVDDNVYAWDLSVFCGARWNADTFNNDQYAQVTVHNLPNTYQQGAAVRLKTDSTANFYAYVVCNQGGWNDRLIKNVAGTVTNLGTHASDTCVTNDVIKVTASGTTITPYINGATTNTPGAQTDSAHSAGSAGVCGQGSGVNTTTRFDNWEGGDLGGAAASLLFPESTRRMQSLVVR